MRAYFFINMYLSSIQQGIQSLHCLGEMHNKYDRFLEIRDAGNEYSTEPSLQLCMLREWERIHKTVVLLNGGFSSDIRELHQFFTRDENTFPFALFTEGADALDGALTCVGIVLPSGIYEGAKIYKKTMSLPRYAYDRQQLEQDNILIFLDESGKEIATVFSNYEIELMNKLNQYKTAN